MRSRFPCQKDHLNSKKRNIFRIKYIALFYVLLSFFDVAGSNAGGEIAHLGGAFIGYVFIRQLQNGVNIGEGVINIINLFSDRKRRKKSTNDVNKGSIETSQDEVDKILDKISKVWIKFNFRNCCILFYKRLNSLYNYPVLCFKRNI